MDGRLLCAAGASPHTFHIPVMGTGFTVDTPLRVARFGISSVVSLVDDVLLEQMRRYHSEREGEPYREIADGEPDSRARRTTAYLDLLQRLVERQMKRLQGEPFAPGTDLTRYFELLPASPLRAAYERMLAMPDSSARALLQEELREQVRPGAIDVNIMTKLDRNTDRHGRPLSPEQSDGVAAVQGFAQSTLRSAVTFSAGFNQRLYEYLGHYDDFFPDERGQVAKRIVLKVSDYRSAAVQGAFLAKRGLWVSEYRVESGLNCGGHAFATKGFLMGPILEEFRRRWEELLERLSAACRQAWANRGRAVPEAPPAVRLTAQGGIGTAAEDQLLRHYYQVDGTGWGTPFMLVPEAVRLDESHLAKLSAAGIADVWLSDVSPLGVPFWTLRDSASEQARRQRIEEDRPGAGCPKGFLARQTDLAATPLCPASRRFQALSLQRLAAQALPPGLRRRREQALLRKACLCHDLAGAATVPLAIDPQATPAICCGPNIAWFSQPATLEEMVGHIYGRSSLPLRAGRPHMFIAELRIYVDYLRTLAAEACQGCISLPATYLAEFKANLLQGIAYYRQHATALANGDGPAFADGLNEAEQAVLALDLPVAETAQPA